MVYSPKKRWRLRAWSQEQAADLAERLGIPAVVGQLLLNRGICDEATARQFLSGGLESLCDPFLMQGMDVAVDRILTALSTGEKITVYGDYDVDGITATSLLFNVLRDFGGNIEYYIPERQSEGYGLHVEALKQIAASGSSLLITVDCGISAYREVDAVSYLDIIITDHHQPPEVLPAAFSVINPKQPGCPYPDKDLAGVGVAYKLCQALSQRMRNGFDCSQYLDIVAIGTVADMVSLHGENRLMVKYGIERLRETDNPGLLALLAVCGINPADINAGKIGFTIAPRLNASGRLHHAAAGVELLTSHDVERVQAIAADLNLTNTERQEVERQILEKAEELLIGTDWNAVKALVLAGDDWHPGVIGIVASRLVERYHRPTVLISVRDGVGKGSCRSIPGFDMYEGLRRCSDLLVQFGGHHQAAGLSLSADNIPSFAHRLNTIAGEDLSDDDFFPVLNIDAQVSLSQVNASLIEQIACLEPFGMGNPSPLLACPNVELQSTSAFGKEKRHLRLWVRDHAANSEVIVWNKGELADTFDRNKPAEIAFIPEVHEWNGRRSVRMRAVDVRQPEGELPDKLSVGKVYLLLKGMVASAEDHTLGLLLDWRKLTSLLASHYGIAMTESGLTFSITVLSELGLISIVQQGKEQRIIVSPPPSEKLDIAASSTWRRQENSL